MSIVTGGVLLGFGQSVTGDCPDPPPDPALAASDNGDGTGAVATLTGSDAGATNVVYYTPATGDVGEHDWAEGGTRTGDGTVALGLDPGDYWLYCRSTLAGLDGFSDLYRLQVTDSADPINGIDFCSQLDYQVFDRRETVVLTSAAREGPEPTKTVADAVRLPLTTREVQASGGAYTQGDLFWVLQGDRLGSTRPKPGDRIADVTDNTWTVLEVSSSTLTCEYRCTARNLAIAYQLRHACDVYRLSNARDAAGGRVEAGRTPLRLNVRCRLQEQPTQREDALGKRQTVRRYTLWMGQQVEVTHQDLVEVRGVGVFEVESSQDPDRIDALQQLNLVKRV